MREAFPTAIGIRILNCGFAILLLYNNRKEAENALTMGSPNSLGDLRLSYDTLMIEPTTCLAGLVISLTSLVVLSKRPGRSREDAWGLELNLLLDHIQGFKELRRQHTPSPYSLRYVLQIVTDWYSIAKARLLEFKPIRVSVGEAAIGFLEMPLGNSPAGQKAWLAGTNRQVRARKKNFMYEN